MTPIRMDVWTGDPPNAIENPEPEREVSGEVGTVSNVSVPTLAVYLPTSETNAGTALIYCSGGSYSTVSAIADEVGNADFFCIPMDCSDRSEVSNLSTQPRLQGRSGRWT